MQGDVEDVPAGAFEPGGRPRRACSVARRATRYAPCRANSQLAAVSPARPLPDDDNVILLFASRKSLGIRGVGLRPAMNSNVQGNN